VLGQRLGVNILLRHFYSSIPAIHELRRKDSWRKSRSMAGVRGADCESQLVFLQSCCTPELQDRLRQVGIHEYACHENNMPSGFGPIEADMLFCYISPRRPCKIVQVGCGVSTTREREESMNDELRKEIEHLRRETNQALKSRYRDLFGEESRSSNHAHLFRRIAWRLQALSEGDLSDRARETFD
jgi:hypothetical protein